MDRSQKLYPNETRAVCDEVINNLLAQNERYNALASAINDFLIEPRMQGNAYSKMKQHISDYGLVAVSIVKANELNISRAQALKVMVGDENLDGEEIISTIEHYDRLITNTYEDARQWEHDRQIVMADPDRYVNYDLEYYKGANPYYATADNYKAMRGVWVKRSEKYDLIESATASFFDEVNSCLAKAQVFLSEIENRTINGADVNIDENSAARIALCDELKDLIDTLGKEDEFRANLKVPCSMEEIEAFWLYDPMFNDKAWYQNEENMYTAIEYLRREIEINGPYALVRPGEQSEADKVKAARIMLLINLLANASYYDAFDRTLPELENSCARYGKDFYDVISYRENGFVVNEDLLNILIRNEKERYYQEFGFWYENGGSDYIDPVINCMNVTDVSSYVENEIQESMGDFGGLLDYGFEDYTYNSGAFNLDGYESQYAIDFGDVITTNYEDVNNLTYYYIH